MSRPNILFLLSDEHSFRFFSRLKERSCGEPVETPCFDRLAENGVAFSDAYCQMPLCTPSRLCLLTGKQVRKAGAWTNGSTLDPSLKTLPQCLNDAGYETSLVGKMHLGGSNQMAGFKHRPYGDLTGGTGHQGQEKPDWYDGSRFRWRIDNTGPLGQPESLLQENIVAQESITWIREHAKKSPDTPWFLCASFSRPHFPLTAPERWTNRYSPEEITPPKAPPSGDAFDHPSWTRLRKEFEVDSLSPEETQRMRSAYFACVSYLDEVVDDMLTRLERTGDLDNTVIVYASDHGELAGEHGGWWKHSFHEASVRVPIIVSLPEHRKGKARTREISTPVGLIDLYPTLCSLAEADIPMDLDGRDLSEAIKGLGDLADEPVVSDNLVPRWGEGSEFRTVRYRNYKYVRFRDDTELLFDLTEDPLEQTDLIRHDPSSEAQRALQWMRDYVSETLDFDEAERERVEWTRRLAREFPLKDHSHHGNHYRLPNGSIMYADGLIYRPDIIASSMSEIVGDGNGVVDSKIAGK